MATVFLVGCAVGGVSGQLVVPKASAQQAATLTKWEYVCGRGIALNAYGAEGWEMVGFGTGETGDRTEVCFKRQKL